MSEFIPTDYFGREIIVGDQVLFAHFCSRASACLARGRVTRILNKTIEIALLTRKGEPDTNSVGTSRTKLIRNLNNVILLEHTILTDAERNPARQEKDGGIYLL